MRKLILVSIVYKGNRMSMFVNALNGRVSMELIVLKLQEMGCWDRGQTFSIG